MISILPQLASSLNRRDEVPNQELAKQIADKNDKNAVKELIDNLSNKKKDIQNDCIKVLYEIGEIKPALIAEYAKEFVALLMNKNNRLQWGGMTALNTITFENPKVIYDSLSKIITACDSGSVITKDHGINILIKLCSIKHYADTVFSLLIEQLLSSPDNQFPAYVEKVFPLIKDDKNRIVFVKMLYSRVTSIEKDTKRKRVEKVIKKIQSGK